MDVGPVFQGVSSLAAATSVFYAARTYINSRVTQQISAIRSGLADAIREANKVDSLLSERYASQIGIAVAESLRRALGDVSTEELSEFFNADSSHNIIHAAIYEGYDKSDVAANLDAAREQFDEVAITIGSLAPNTSVLFELTSAMLLTPLESAFSIRHLRQVYTNKKNRANAVKGIKSAPTGRLAFAMLADAVSSVPSLVIGDGGGQQIFDESERILDILCNRFLNVSDAEMRRQFALDRSLKNPPSKEGKISQILEHYIKHCRRLFSPLQVEEMLQAAARLQVILHKAPD